MALPCLLMLRARCSVLSAQCWSGGRVRCWVMLTSFRTRRCPDCTVFGGSPLLCSKLALAQMARAMYAAAEALSPSVPLWITLKESMVQSDQRVIQ